MQHIVVIQVIGFGIDLSLLQGRRHREPHNLRQPGTVVTY